MARIKRIGVIPRPLVRKFIDGYVKFHNNPDPNDYNYMSESKAVNELVMYAINNMPPETRKKYLPDD